MVTETDDINWSNVLAPYRSPSRRSAVIQLLNTAVPFVVLWYLMVRSLSVSYWLTLLLAVAEAFMYARLFIIQHDCGHGSFLRSRRAMDVIGSLLGVVTLFPYAYWRRTHALHHATSGKLDQREFGDISTLTVREYLALSPWKRLTYRLYRHPLVLLGVGPTYQFVFKHRFPWDIPRSWKREWASVFATNFGIAASVWALSAAFGWRSFLLVHGTMMLIAGALGVFLFYVQHQFERTYWDQGDEWDPTRAAVDGSSYFDMPAWLHWCTGNIGFHHIHHLASQIPNYRLARCFRENPALPAARLTIRDSVRCLRLRLWDEDRRTMVGFEAVREASPALLAPPIVAVDYELP